MLASACLVMSKTWGCQGCAYRLHVEVSQQQAPSGTLRQQSAGSSHGAAADMGLGAQVTRSPLHKGISTCLWSSRNLMHIRARAAADSTKLVAENSLGACTAKQEQHASWCYSCFAKSSPSYRRHLGCLASLAWESSGFDGTMCHILMARHFES